MSFKNFKCNTGTNIYYDFDKNSYIEIFIQMGNKNLKTTLKEIERLSTFQNNFRKTEIGSGLTIKQAKKTVTLTL